MTDQGFPPEQIDTSKPHPARIYDYALGGKTHYPVDAAAAQEVLKVFPGGSTCARANRAFMIRAARWLAREAGCRQYLDIGTGIPTEPNLHQIVQETIPEAAVVYTDNDPIVLTYARALLHGTPEGRTAYLHADVRDPDSILRAPQLRETLDLAQPVALSLNAVMHYLTDEDRPYEVVSRLLEPLAPGSYLVLTHITPEFAPEAWAKVEEINRAGDIPGKFRTREEVARFFEGLELVDPGLVLPNRWRPDPADPLADASPTDLSLWAGVARKP